MDECPDPAGLHLKTGEDNLSTAAAEKCRNEDTNSVIPETTHTHRPYAAISATKTINPNLVSSVISDAALANN